MLRLLLAAAFCCAFVAPSADEGTATDINSVALSDQEQQLFELLTEYRTSKGLPEIPWSPALTVVAQTHVYDLQTNRPDTSGCNLHSWSDQGDWSACCYQWNVHAPCAWNKPLELTNYPGYGYEIAMSFTGELSPEIALQAWQKSPGHNACMVNEGTWDQQWLAVGIGMSENYAVIWFGYKRDPNVQVAGESGK